MAVIRDATLTWSDPILLDSDEIWQARKGSVFITTTESPDAEDGIALVQGQGVLIRSGSQVRYRKEEATEALIVHEVV